MIAAIIFSLSVLVTLSMALSPESLDVPLQSKAKDEIKAKKLELFDGVALKFPVAGENSTDKLFSVELDLNKAAEEGKDIVFIIIF